MAAWIRKRLPEQIKLPSDSFQISREHWERTMGRAREATWHLGTMLDHQVVGEELASCFRLLGARRAIT